VKAHDRGIDVLGDGMGDFIPWLNVAGKMMGGMGGGGQQGAAGGAQGAPQVSAQQAVQQAMAQERARQAAEKAATEAKNMKLITYGLIGAVALGGVVLVLRK
jgi:hypothetical protein